MKPRIAVLVVCSFASVLLWVPILAWVFSPERNILLGAPGRFLLIATLSVQIVAILFAWVFRGVVPAWNEVRSRAVSIVLGWIGFVAAMSWAWWVAVSLLETDSDYVVLALLGGLFLVPAVMPVSWARALTGLLIAAVTWAASLIFVLEVPAVVLIAPVTVYVFAAAISGLRAIDAQRGAPYSVAAS